MITYLRPCYLPGRLKTIELASRDRNQKYFLKISNIAAFTCNSNSHNEERKLEQRSKLSNCFLTCFAGDKSNCASIVELESPHTYSSIEPKTLFSLRSLPIAFQRRRRYWHDSFDGATPFASSFEKWVSLKHVILLFYNLLIFPLLSNPVVTSPCSIYAILEQLLQWCIEYLCCYEWCQRLITNEKK